MNNVENNVVAEATETVCTEVHFKRDYAPHRRSSIRICKECGKAYIMTDNDVLYYVHKYDTLPLKCEACRKKAREANPYPKTDETSSVSK